MLSGIITYMMFGDYFVRDRNWLNPYKMRKIAIKLIKFCREVRGTDENTDISFIVEVPFSMLKSDIRSILEKEEIDCGGVHIKKDIDMAILSLVLDCDPEKISAADYWYDADDIKDVLMDYSNRIYLCLQKILK